MSQIQHYFIILSEHNIAEYRACLHLQPQNVHLIVTDWVAGKNAHIRFKNTLEQSEQFHGKIHELGFQSGGKLFGERTKEIQSWLQTVFKAYCAEHRIAKNAILNITGGTKILSQMLAAQTGIWQEMHYQAFQRSSNQIHIDRLNPDNLAFLDEIVLHNRFSLRDGLKLYADEIGEHSPNPIIKHPDSLPLAQMRFAAQNMKQPENGNLFPAVMPVLENAWTQKYPKDQKEILLEWQAFGLAQPDELKPFLERLINLIDPQDQIRLDEKGLILPIKYKKNKTQTHYWKKWISGDWFEQLIYTWLKENGVKDEELETGLQLIQGESKGNETDILLFRKNQLIFCELKSDLSSESKLADPLRQVIDQSLNMGKVRRVLILSPVIKNNAKPQQWTAFERNCAAKNIQIIIAVNKESLKILTN
ncbi:hypothetical protein CYJ99_00225 [Neisseria perflava]|uniref:Uncharacterized protein n=1 Tax=Neisseria perflava TaxID=33053 RepID=A0A9X7F9F1_NEIPE|nr:hypothetical protein [Neisseria perflava]PLA50780.1 hypothetical protein CYJ99_00225 [Neisseria perflava]WOS98383.1 hypothetical protein CYJ98_001645 [Neisseria perflava]